MSSWALVAHTYNPHYSEGRDEEDHGLKPAQANTSQNPVLKNLSQNKTGRVAQGEGPEFKPSKRRRREEEIIQMSKYTKQYSTFSSIKEMQSKPHYDSISAKLD
jgi:hypothetical protein